MRHLTRSDLVHRLGSRSGFRRPLQMFVALAALVLLVIVGSGGSVRAQTAAPAGCKITGTSKSGMMMCPASVPIPPAIASHLKRPFRPPVRIQPGTGDPTADYSCDPGEHCNAAAEMTEGIVYISWYGYDLVDDRTYNVADYTGQCTDPSGCWFQTWWTPPNSGWAGETVDMTSDVYVEIIACWCQDGTNNCEIFD